MNVDQNAKKRNAKEPDCVCYAVSLFTTVRDALHY